MDAIHGKQRAFAGFVATSCYLQLPHSSKTRVLATFEEIITRLGLEPRMSEPKSEVLPITPPGKAA